MDFISHFRATIFINHWDKIIVNWIPSNWNVKKKTNNFNNNGGVRVQKVGEPKKWTTKKKHMNNKIRKKKLGGVLLWVAIFGLLFDSIDLSLDWFSIRENQFINELDKQCWNSIHSDFNSFIQVSTAVAVVMVCRVLLLLLMFLCVCVCVWHPHVYSTFLFRFRSKSIWSSVFDAMWCGVLLHNGRLSC